MKHPERVDDYLEHILEAIERATRYLQSLQRIEEFKSSELLQDAVIRNIQIIGEAARQIHELAPEFPARHPQIPWEQMRGMRNVVTHEYFFVNLQIVWTTVRSDLPRLKEQIHALLLAQQLKSD